MEKERDFLQFIEILREATSRIEQEYFLLPVAGSDDAIYKERIYCYELYHRLREGFEKNRFPYSLAGEVDKNGHLIIYPKIGAKKPDLIVHVPGIMNKNLVAIEVKPINARLQDLKKDLKTLIGFLTAANYPMAMQLIYGGPEEIFKGRIKYAFKKEMLRFSNSLYLFWHEAPQKKVKEYNWARLVRDTSND